MGRGFVATLAIVLLAGCGGAAKTENPKHTLSSIQEIRDALGSANLGCTGYKSAPKDQREFGSEDAVDVGRCRIGNEAATLIVWKDVGQKEHWVDLGQKLGCVFGAADGVKSFSYVDGGLWTISDVPEQLAKKIADAIGGQATSIGCGQTPKP